MSIAQSRFLSLAPLSAAIFCFVMAGNAAADLTSNSWQVSATDQRNVSWAGSQLHFLIDSPDGANRSLSGYFDWTSSRGEFGRENFTGTLLANNHLVVDGNAIVSPARGLVLGHYEADLNTSGTQLINGFWTGSGIPGTWTASAVPEPETYTMFLAGLGLLGFMSQRRKNSPK